MQYQFINRDTFEQVSPVQMNKQFRSLLGKLDDPTYSTAEYKEFVRKAIKVAQARRQNYLTPDSWWYLGQLYQAGIERDAVQAISNTYDLRVFE